MQIIVYANLLYPKIIIKLHLLIATKKASIYIYKSLL